MHAACLLYALVGAAHVAAWHAHSPIATRQLSYKRPVLQMANFPAELGASDKVDTAVDSMTQTPTEYLDPNFLTTAGIFGSAIFLAVYKLVVYFRMEYVVSAAEV